MGDKCQPMCMQLKLPKQAVLGVPLPFPSTAGSSSIRPDCLSVNGSNLCRDTLVHLLNRTPLEPEACVDFGKKFVFVPESVSSSEPEKGLCRSEIARTFCSEPSSL
jgi:hypothetical protein